MEQSPSAFPAAGGHPGGLSVLSPTAQKGPLAPALLPSRPAPPHPAVPAQGGPRRPSPPAAPARPQREAPRPALPSAGPRPPPRSPAAPRSPRRRPRPCLRVVRSPESRGPLPPAPRPPGELPAAPRPAPRPRTHLSRPPPPLLVLPGPARLLPHAAILETLGSQMSPPQGPPRCPTGNGVRAAAGTAQRERARLRADYNSHSAPRRRTAAEVSGMRSPLCVRRGRAGSRPAFARSAEQHHGCRPTPHRNPLC